MSLVEIVAVVALGTLVGLDLASVPQAMIARPLVSGFIGGLVVGNPLPGLALGALCELFALETLPVGAARYPDWGPGTLAVGALAGAHQQGMLASGFLGLALVAVVAALAGGQLIHVVRRRNVAATVRLRARLEAGDPAAVRAIQRSGLLADGMRALGLTALTLGAGDLISTLFARQWGGSQRVALIALAATSIGVALSSGSRLAGPGRRSLWFAGGLGTGTALVAVLWFR